MQTYFSTEFLAFFETLLQIRRPVLIGNELVENVSVKGAKPATLPTDGGGIGGPPSPTAAGEKDEGEAAAAAMAATSEAEGRAARGGGPSDAGAGASYTSTVPPTGQFDMLRVVSRRFRGKSYDVLARELILKGAMPLGLYRPAGTKGSSLPYTQVNPSVAERLVGGDVVFVLRSRSCSLVGSV